MGRRWLAQRILHLVVVTTNIDLSEVFDSSLVWKTMVFDFWLMGRWMVQGKDW